MCSSDLCLGGHRCRALVPLVRAGPGDNYLITMEGTCSRHSRRRCPLRSRSSSWQLRWLSHGWQPCPDNPSSSSPARPQVVTPQTGKHVQFRFVFGAALHEQRFDCSAAHHRSSTGHGPAQARTSYAPGRPCNSTRNGIPPSSPRPPTVTGAPAPSTTTAAGRSLSASSWRSWPSLATSIASS